MIVGVSPITPPVKVVVPSSDRKNHVQLYAQATPGAHARAEPSNVTGSPTCGVDVLITNDVGGGGGGGGGGVVVVVVGGGVVVAGGGPHAMIDAAR